MVPAVVAWSAMGVEVAPVLETAMVRVVVMPLLVVNRNSHFRRIPVIHVFAAAVVLGTPEILWVVDIRVVIKAVPILGVVRAGPTVSVRLLSLGTLGTREQAKAENANEREADHTNHRKSPLGWIGGYRFVAMARSPNGASLGQ